MKDYDKEFERETPKRARRKNGRVKNCTKLNIRERASKTSDVKMVIIVGTEVEFQNFNDHWVRLWVNDIEGFAMKTYIEEI